MEQALWHATAVIFALGISAVILFLAATTLLIMLLFQRAANKRFGHPIGKLKVDGNGNIY
jgi:hypothetical protein